MFHDIVLALGGIGGEVLKNLVNEEIYSAISLFHPCEKSILKELINIAEYYKTLKTFIKKVPQFGTEYIILDDGSSLKPGMYLRAFCNGLHISLEPYRKNLIELEKQALQNPHLTLSGILAEVSTFLPLLTTLNSVVNQIVARKLHGCKILQILHEHLYSGIQMVDEAMARILQCCHLVMLKQLTSWLLHGHLLDPYKEFFIEACFTPNELSCSATTVESTTSRGTTATLESDGLPEIPVGEIDIEYRIIQDQVPNYIPPSVPEKAKFIGSTVVLFSRNPREKTSDLMTYGSIYDKMESSLLDQLRCLQHSAMLEISQLEAVLDNVRSCVTQHLFSLAKDGADLMGELKLIKDFYLLGRGELFVSFLRKSATTLFKPISSNSSRDISNLLYVAARNVQLNSDEIMGKFSLTVPPKSRVPTGTQIWSVMTLEYNPPWPLHLLFTQNVLSTYNSLFSFLLQVKIAELNLHEVWIENTKLKEKQLLQEVWTLRNLLTFLINNLQCYLQVDVLESEYSKLVIALNETKDFEQVIHQHSLFLSHISVQAFLPGNEVQHPDQPTTTKRHPVNTCLLSILRLCDNFCSEVAKCEINKENLMAISKSLDNNIAVLMNLITLLGNKASGLRLLLLRLDYNRYFSKQNCK